MTEPTLSDRDKEMIEKILGESAIDDDLAREELEQMLLERDAEIESLERRLNFSKGQAAYLKNALTNAENALKSAGTMVEDYFKAKK